MTDQRDDKWAYAPPPPPDDIVDRIMAAVAADAEGVPPLDGADLYGPVDAVEPPPPARAPGRSPVGGRHALFAAAAVAVALGLTWWQLAPAPAVATGSGHVIVDARRIIALSSRARAVAQPGADVAWRVTPDGVEVTQRRGRVMYRVKPGGPFEVRTPAGTASVIGTEFLVEVDDMSNKTIQYGALGAVGAAVAVAVVVYSGRVVLGNDRGEVALAAGERGVATEATAPARDVRTPDRTVATARDDRDGPPRVRRFATADARERLLRDITAARAHRASAAATPAPEPAAPALDPAPDLDREYIQGVIRDAVPLLRECYELARSTEPDLEGRLDVTFHIAGEPEVGGLVEDVEIGQDTDIGRSPEMSECVRQTMLSLEFVPPSDGGSVEVRYPLLFRRDPPE